MHDSTMILQWEQYEEHAPGMPDVVYLAAFFRKVPVNVWTTVLKSVEGVWWA